MVYSREGIVPVTRSLCTAPVLVSAAGEIIFSSLPSPTFTQPDLPSLPPLSPSFRVFLSSRHPSAAAVRCIVSVTDERRTRGWLNCTINCALRERTVCNCVECNGPSLAQIPILWSTLFGDRRHGNCCGRAGGCLGDFADARVIG